MKYFEKFKKSQTKVVPGGREIQLGASYVTNVIDENGDKMKFEYNVNEQKLRILGDFGLISVEYES